MKTPWSSALAVWFFALTVGAYPATGPVKVAVVPFENITRDPNADWIGVGIAESLTIKLSQTTDIRMVERVRIHQVMKEQAFQGSGFVEGETVKAGELLGADWMVTGGYQKLSDQIRVTARIVNVESGEVVKGVEVTGSERELFSMQDRVAEALVLSVSGLAEHFSGGSDSGGSAGGGSAGGAVVDASPSPEAFADYAQALDLIEKGDIKGAERKLKEAVKADPDFELARMTLSFVQWSRPSRTSSLYSARLQAAPDEVFAALLAAVNEVDNVELVSSNPQTYEIKAKQKLSLYTVGQEITINVESFPPYTGVRILSRVKKFLGIRPLTDWGESRRSIERLIVAFERRL